MSWTRTSWADEALKRACAKVEGAVEGERNDTLFKQAAEVANYVDDGTLGYAEARAALEAAGLRAGLTGKEVRDSLQSGLARGDRTRAWYPERADRGHMGPVRSSNRPGPLPRSQPRVEPDLSRVPLLTCAMPPDATVRLTCFSSARGTKGEARVVTWSELADAVARPQRWPAEGKSGIRMWCPFEIEGDDRSQRPNGTYPDGRPKKRSAEVYRAHAVFLDYDDDPAFGVEQVRAWWGDVSYVLYTSASHLTPKGNKPPLPRGRVVLALSRPVTVEEYLALVPWFVACGRGRLAATELGTRGRAYFAPAQAPGGYAHDANLADMAIDVDAMLEAIRNAPPATEDEHVGEAPPEGPDPELVARVIARLEAYTKQLEDAGSKSGKAQTLVALRNDEELRADLLELEAKDWQDAWDVLRANCHGVTKQADAWHREVTGAATFARLQQEGKPIVPWSPSLDEVVRGLTRALVDRPDFFVGPSRPVILGRHYESGQLEVRPLDADGLRVSIHESAYLVDKDGRPMQVPVDVSRAIISRGEWDGARYLGGISHVPVLREDGSICQVDGYDEASRTFVELHGEFPSIPERPTQDDARNAAARLVDVWAEYPFAHPASASAMLALVLSVVGRRLIDGPVPMTIIEANEAGAGKGLAVDTAGFIALGRKPPSKTAPVGPDADNEWRKIITSWARQGALMAKVDNVVGRFGSASIDAALTETKWEDRLLGTNDIMNAPWRCVLVATANNVELSAEADIVRRILPVRIEVDRERPEDREFKRANLLDWVKERRHALYCDALTVLRAYIAAGRPKVGVKALGSYEAWCALVPSAIVWCGLPNPLEVRETLVREDPKRMLLARVLDELSSAFPRGEFTPRELIDAAERCTCGHPRHTGACGGIPCRCTAYRPARLGLRDALEDLMGDGRPLTPIGLGRRLNAIKGKPDKGRRLMGRFYRNQKVWHVHRQGCPICALHLVGEAAEEVA